MMKIKRTIDKLILKLQINRVGLPCCLILAPKITRHGNKKVAAHR